MKTNLFKKSITLFLLTLFTCGNVFGFQTFIHDDDHNHQDRIEECLVCDKALLDQFSPLDIAPESAEVSKKLENFHQDLVNEYTSVVRSSELSAILFSRPPPVLT